MLNSKILLIENESIIAIDLKSRLENLGYNIIGIVNKGEVNKRYNRGYM